MPKVSVIVPVYNAENVIERCVNSILNQEFKDLELILIDDGSKDRSAELLDGFAANDERVKVIHKPNSGVSDTRNRGIDEAKGTFLQFLDADDWITEDATKMLVRTAEEKDADLVVGEFYRVVGENLSRKGSIPADRVLTRKEYAEYMKQSPADYYYGVLWNKLYRKSILDQYAIRLDSSVSFCEDFIFNLEYVLHCTRIAPLLLPVYYYVKTDGSLVAQNMNLEKLLAMKTSVYQYYDEFFRNVLDEETYRRERMEIASFLIRAASDDLTLPMAPGTKKVDQLSFAVKPLKGETITNVFRYSKMLYGQYLENAGMLNDLSRSDVIVFHAVDTLRKATSIHEISLMTSLPEHVVLTSLQTLLRKGFIRLEWNPLSASVRTEGAAGLIHDIDNAGNDLRDVWLEGMSEEERQRLNGLLEKVLQRLEKRLGVEDDRNHS